MPSRALQDGRSAFEHQAWKDAFASLTAADAEAPLEPHDLERLATTAYLIGEDQTAIQAWTRAYTTHLDRSETSRAARCAVWITFAMTDHVGQQAQATGWLERVRRLLDATDQPCAEQGWWLCAVGRQRVSRGDVAGALTAFEEAGKIGARFGDSDLAALGRHGEGRALLAMRKPAEGFARLDEVMVAITNHEVGPIITGAVYCSVISACHDVFDLRRAQEWTQALQAWCDSQPGIVAFRGSCLIRRSELMRLHGAWRDALGEAERACGVTIRAAHEHGLAHYQLGELLRLHGDFDRAIAEYKLASQAGRRPQPGLARLRLALGQTDEATAAIRQALSETAARRVRVDLLDAAVDILIASGDVQAARRAADELATIAGEIDAPYLRALSAQAAGAVALANTESSAALESLRRAQDLWQQLDAPYEIARVRVLAGQAYRALGDREGAQLEFDAAQEAFDRLGASPDAARVASLAAVSAPPASGGLTGREVEVLRLLATGATNRAIASRLEISEKTVARHVSNIFTKLDLPSRAAATAYAYQRKLL